MRTLRLLAALALAALALAAAAAGSCRPAPTSLVLATTTSVANSGLLEKLVPEYERQARIRVRTVAVGSGRALSLLSMGQADAVISHAPEQERKALDEHPDWSYRKILFNDFLIVGPSADRAGVGGAADVLDALRRIASSGERFVSRGDESGTHEREKQLWRAAQVAPPFERMLTSGQGMSATLRIASEMAAYTLTDRATFLHLARQLRLKELHAGDARLLNTYAVMAPASNPNGAALAAWLADGGGRDLLSGLTASDRLVGFQLWPIDTPGTDPGAVPF